MRTWFLFATVVVLLSFSGCGRENDKAQDLNPDNTRQLVGNWQLTQPASTTVTLLTVDIDQLSGGTASGIYSLKLSGSAPVNTYITTAKLINWATGSIEVTGITSTKKAGTAEAMRFEQMYYANLQAVNRYELTGTDKLSLYYPGGVLLYKKMN